MTQQKSDTTSETKPEISKVECNFPIEEELRRNWHGESFEDMQDSEIEYVTADRQIATQEGNKAVRIWLSNGAHIRYELVKENQVEEATYSADDPNSVRDSKPITLSHGGIEDLIKCVQSSMNEYLSARRDTAMDFENDWKTVYAIIK